MEILPVISPLSGRTQRAPLDALHLHLFMHLLMHSALPLSPTLRGDADATCGPQALKLGVSKHLLRDRGHVEGGKMGFAPAAERPVSSVVNRGEEHPWLLEARRVRPVQFPYR